MTTVVKIQVDDSDLMPMYASAEAAGMDLRAAVAIELRPLERQLVPTGVRVVLPPGYEAQVRPRSGLALKHGIGMVNAPGTIDSDYRGEIGVLLINLGTETVQLSRGERIAQLVVAPVVRADLVRIGDVSTYGTERGEGGFGSTGR